MPHIVNVFDWLPTDTAVHKLTQPWTDVLSPKESGNGKYRPVNYPPLLTMLNQAKNPSIGRTGTGRVANAERSLLNLEAFALWEHIDGTTRAWLTELTTTPPTRELTDALTQLAGLLKALHASHQITEKQLTRITNQLPRWCDRIWQLFDPPTVKNLTGKCPNCLKTIHISANKTQTTALIAYYWKGITPEATCQNCGERWSGEKQLLNLGFHLGATIDETSLHEMGII